MWRKKTDEDVKEEGEKRGEGGRAGGGRVGGGVAVAVMRIKETFRRYLRKKISDGWKMMVHQAPISS